MILNFVEVEVHTNMESRKQENKFNDVGANSDMVKQAQNGLVFNNSANNSSVKEENQNDTEQKGKTCSSCLG